MERAHRGGARQKLAMPLETVRKLLNIVKAPLKAF
jgi:hypothetical protein